MYEHIVFEDIGTLIELPKVVKLYKIKKDRVFLKPFGYKVMTIFTIDDCHFTTFRRLLVANEYTETQIILFEGYYCQITA